jgi:peptidoglycan/LPS O-acetylase OafA/YrhL
MNYRSLFSSLRRVTSKGNFIPEIDGLRFLAIFPVLLAHANTNYLRTFGNIKKPDLGVLDIVMERGGIVGVWIFFAISGFILSLSFANHFYVNKKPFSELKLKSFYIRRLTRLEPPFLISTLLLFVFVGLFVAKSISSILPNLLATVTYTHYLIFGERSPINPVSWSLETEIQFYLISPFICAILFKMKESYRTLLIIILIVLIPIIVYAIPNSPFIRYPVLSRTLPAFFSHFLIGILFASLYTGNLWKKIKEGNYLWDFVVVGSIIGCFLFVPNSEKLYTFYLFDFLVLLIMIGTFKGVIFRIFFSNAFITSIGGMCYSIYLIHYAVIFGVSLILKKMVFDEIVMNYTFHMSIFVISAMVASVIFFVFCEKPFMYKDWPAKLKLYFSRSNKSTLK